MNKLNNILRTVLVLFLLCFSSNVYAKKAKKRGQLVVSIREAMDRSESDQDRIKDQMNSEADERIETWSQRKQDMIEIKGTSNLEPAHLGDAELFYGEETGIDQSGLGSLHSGDASEEPIHINFDEELREVGSIKD